MKLKSPIGGFAGIFELMSEETKAPKGAELADDKRSFGKDKDGGLDGMGAGRAKAKRRRKVSYLTLNKIESVDYKDIALLKRFINERGKILSSRQTGNTAKQQRMITSAINQARELALLPFVVNDTSGGREFTPRRSRDYAPREPRREAPREEAAPAAAATE